MLPGEKDLVSRVFGTPQYEFLAYTVTRLNIHSGRRGRTLGVNPIMRDIFSLDKFRRSRHALRLLRLQLYSTRVVGGYSLITTYIFQRPTRKQFTYYFMLF